MQKRDGDQIMEVKKLKDEILFEDKIENIDDYSFYYFDYYTINPIIAKYK